MLRRAQHERLINSIGLREIMEEYVFSIMDSLVSVSFSPGFLASLSRIGVFTVLVLSFSSAAVSFDFKDGQGRPMPIISD